MVFDELVHLPNFGKLSPRLAQEVSRFAAAGTSMPLRLQMRWGELFAQLLFVLHQDPIGSVLSYRYLFQKHIFAAYCHQIFAELFKVMPWQHVPLKLSNLFRHLESGACGKPIAIACYVYIIWLYRSV